MSKDRLNAYKGHFFSGLKTGAKLAAYFYIGATIAGLMSPLLLTFGAISLANFLILPLVMLISNPIAWTLIGMIFIVASGVAMGIAKPLFHLAKDLINERRTPETPDRNSVLGVERDSLEGESRANTPDSKNSDVSSISLESGYGSDGKISSPINTGQYDANYGSQDLVNQTQAGNYNYLLQQADVACLARIVHGLDPEVHEIVGSTDHLKKQLNRFKNEIEKNEGSKKLIFIVNLYNGHWVTLCVNYCNKQLGAYYYDSLNGKENRSTFTEILKKELNMDENNIRFFNKKTQDDGSNCGIFALEAAGRVNQMLNKGISFDDMGGVLSEFKPTANELETLRNQLAEILSNDEGRSGFIVTDLTPPPSRTDSVLSSQSTASSCSRM